MKSQSSKRRVHSHTRRRRSPLGGPGTATASCSSTKSTERECQLEKQIQDLKEQLREQEIQSILDLRVASGILVENERSKSAERLAKMPADVLKMLRTDLVKIVARLTSVTSPPASSTESVHREAQYIA